MSPKSSLKRRRANTSKNQSDRRWDSSSSLTCTARIHIYYMYTKRPLLTLPLFEKLHDKLRQTAHLPLWSQDGAASLLMNESTTSYIVRCKIRTDMYTDNIWHYKVVNVQQTIDVPTSVNQFTSLLVLPATAPLHTWKCSMHLARHQNATSINYSNPWASPSHTRANC